MSNTDRYVTVRLERHAHEDCARFAERWGLTKSDALTMLVRRGLASANTDRDTARELREESSARERAKTLALRGSVTQDLDSPARRIPTPLPATGVHTGHLEELATAVELLTTAIRSMQERPRAHESGTLPKTHTGTE